MSQYLFVYGTLLSQYDNEYAQLLKTHSTLIGTGYIHGLLYSTPHYPGILTSKNYSEKVYGQVLQISPKENYVLTALDQYEGVGVQFQSPNEYIRSILPVYTDGNLILDCWVYIYNHSVDNMIKIPSGKYQDFIAPKG